jgi:hypothetical protein
MRKLNAWLIAHHSKKLDNASSDGATTMHSESRGFVDGNQIVIFE